MFKNLKQTVAAMMVLFGFGAEADIPINAVDKSLDLSEDQVKKLKAHFGDDYAASMISGVNKEIKAFMNKDMDLKAIKDELDALVKEDVQLNAELENKGGAEASTEDVSVTLAAISANQTKLRDKNNELEAQVQKLMKEGVGDIPNAVIQLNPGMKAKHSATHLFASNAEWDKFEKRSWNARLRDGSIKATDFNSDGNIPLLQNDLEHFVRENPTKLESMFNDVLQLPKEWSHRTGVLDRVADAVIIPAEIVQGRAPGWSPKNKFHIEAEEGKVFRKKIDITFSGYQLQEMENTWIRSYNANDGSHPWKMSFIGFLLSELVKRQMVDDRVAQINGIYSYNGGGDNNPGRNIDSQDGLRFLFWKHRDVTKKYKAFDVGTPTKENIVDYVRTIIESIPEIERAEQGLEFGLSQAWLDAYRVKAGLEYQMHKSTDSGSARYDKDYPIDYPNILFQPLRDMVKTDFMYVTQSTNIEVLDYNVSEKGKFTVTHEKRDTHIFADYRLGIRFKFVGTKLASGDPAEFERQKIWSNSVPIFDASTTMPLFDDKSGLVNFHYSNIKVDADFTTDITNIENAPKGSIIRITGNTGMVAAKNVKDNANFDLTADFNLQLGGTLTLLVNADGTMKELKRTTAPESATSTDVSFGDATIDANEGSVFRYTGAADGLDAIINGVEGKTIRIYGGGAGALTISDVANNIEVVSNAVLTTAANYIDLTKIDGVWFETKRLIA